MSIMLTNIHKWLNKRPVISNVSLEVKDSELFVLLGGSGSGKSTLLRIIAGLIPADEGSVFINGHDVTNLAPQGRNVGFVFQNYSVFRYMTVSENIEFGLRIRNIPANERRKRSAELLDLVDLTGLGARYPNQLSGGQQQRIALARALAYNPTVLLLDEPFGALDIKIRTQLRRSLKNIQRQLNMTMILVTHDQEEAFELADRVGVIDYGQLIEVGSSEALYHYPQKEFTAKFIGGGNVLVGRKEGNAIKLGTASLTIPEGSPVYDQNVPLRILFRPETVILQETPFTADQCVEVLGKGRVKELTFSGSLQRLSLEVKELQGVQSLLPQPTYGQSSTLIVAIKPSTADKEAHFKPGQELWIGLRDYHILDPSGLKILAYTDDSLIGASAAAYGLFLGRTTGGSVTLLTVVNKPERIAEARERLEDLVHNWRQRLVSLTTKVRAGNVAMEIINEAYQEHYEICLINKQAPELKATKIWQLLLDYRLPVMLVQDAPHKVHHILICIAGGEPGKDDILFGGRVAKLTGAQTTLLHITSKASKKEESKRIERYLHLGKTSLKGIGVESNIKIEENDSPVEAITAEMETGIYDLLIIGAPGSETAERLLWPNLTLQIINRTSLPVLIVPKLHE